MWDDLLKNKDLDIFDETTKETEHVQKHPGIDYVKLSKFIQFSIYINEEQRQAGTSKTYRGNFRSCTHKDFDKRNLHIHEQERQSFQKRLCPDMDTFSNKLRVKNSYSNQKDRVSFVVHAEVCDKNK